MYLNAKSYIRFNTFNNMVLPKAGLKCFYETFVLKQTLVILLKFSAKNPPHRQAEKRCATPYKNTA